MKIKSVKRGTRWLLILGVMIKCCVIHASHHESSSPKTVLLTGAAGFIGSNFLKYMFDKYPTYTFLVLDALTYAGSLDNIPAYIHDSSRFKFFYGSVTNSRLVDLLMKQSHFVVHFAAESHVTRSICDSAIFFDTDVIGTRVLLESLVLHKNVERFIHISTSEVCGTAEIIPMDEDHPIKPRSPYAAAKAGADRMVYAYQCTYDIPTVIIRPFNNYGPNQHLEKVIPRFIRNALENEPLTIHGDGLQTRDWMHVEDTCRALDMVLQHKNFDEIKHEVINIGSGKDISVLEVAQLVRGIFGLREEAIVFVPDRPGQVSRHIASITKAQRLLGWEPKVTFEDGLQSVASWYASHPRKRKESMSLVPILIGDDIVVLQ
jgi:dTDP-glucose 4,6-dehydratase